MAKPKTQRRDPETEKAKLSRLDKLEKIYKDVKNLTDADDILIDDANLGLELIEITKKLKKRTPNETTYPEAC